MPQWVTSSQGGSDWLIARAGSLSASRMAAAMSFLKSGKESEDRRKLKISITSERMTGLNTEIFVTDAMKWGLEKEWEAKERFEEETGIILTPCGFALHDTIENFGASPDSLIDDDGVFEAKAPTTAKYVEWRIAGVVPEEHHPQLLAQLAVTKRRYSYFCAYDPRVLHRPHQIFIRKFEPPEEKIIAVEDAARKFLAEVNELFERVTEDAP